ncbi:MAG: nucleotidyltransferase family protein [Thermodesulfobacteriota bacterium]|nr:nucleotidyltransferase family protein [Thermodesulfobacteriota bacterium]
MNHITHITVTILAGGLGTRLRSVIAHQQKVLAPIGGRPFLSFILDKLVQTGFRNVILCTGYKAHEVMATFGYRYKELSIQYSCEPEPLGTGGTLRYASPLITSESTLVMNGDSYIESDLNAYIDWFFKKEKQATLLVTKVNDTSQYGKVDMDNDGLITGFYEKNSRIGKGLVNAGVYLFRTSLIHTIPHNIPLSLEKDFLPTLVGKKLYGYYCEGTFIDIGTPETYAMSEVFFKHWDMNTCMSKNAPRYTT